MTVNRSFLFFLLGFLSLKAFSQYLPVHDPVVIKQDSTYYLFSTGLGISVFSSSDLINWKKESPVFKTIPEWAKNTIPGFNGHIWAPDISFYGNKYYLYYSVSAFGKNTSCIGVATNSTLNPSDKSYHWEDHGMVIQSVPGRDLWNAIDPNLAFDEDNQPWLVFGSFWDGIKMVKLDQNLRSVAEPQEWYTLAKRRRDFKTPDNDPGEGAVEAPFLFKKNDYYYLFVSFDFCCRGVNSNYKIMVGRSKNITGPFMDKAGNLMTEGGGSVVLAGDNEYAGTGHNSVYTIGDTDYLFFHGYKIKNEGKPELIIKKIDWDTSGWPYVTTNQ